MKVVMTLCFVMIALPKPVSAASCCGGGSASSLVLPKFGKSMLALSLDSENYDGFWNNDGDLVADPPGSNLSQYRLNLGAGYRLSSNWQASAVMPYVWNDNQYAGFTTNTSGLGDVVASVWYEAFDAITCVWKVNKLADLKPAIYYGLSMTLPTGISPYADVENSFDITGRGFYRLDATILLDKTIYPWNATLQYTHGVYLERPVNREYGNYVEPYDKNLGDRTQAMMSFGYSYQTDEVETVTATLAYSELKESAGEIDNIVDPTGGLNKKSLAMTFAFSTFGKNWIYKLTYSQATEGNNFPSTDIVTLGVNHVYF